MYPLPPLVTVTSVTRPPVTVAVAVAPPDIPTDTLGSPINPTAPFHVNAPVGRGNEGQVLAIIPSVVAGSPGDKIPG